VPAQTKMRLVSPHRQCTYGCFDWHTSDVTRSTVPRPPRG
jgi:hypothetical protein